jgi:NAD(P)-dependent dehydrogenase (short-subunit alcohol dehydrogenase family)
MDAIIKNKISVITGGGSGIGKALAISLAKHGAVVEIFGTSQEPLTSTCVEIKNANNENVCNYKVGDVSVQTDVESFVDDVISRYGKIDILINCAGWISEPRTIEEVTIEDFDRSFAVNVKSIFLFSKKLLPIMKKQDSGTIINITSTAGIYANASLPIYSASKFAARGLSQAIGKSILESNLSYFSVAPAGTNTPMRKKLFGEQDSAKQQSAEAVAEIILDAILKKLDVANGGEIVIRDGKVSEINNPIKK